MTTLHLGNDWMDDAACQGMDIETFFPGRGAHAPVSAVQVCRRCRVQNDCREYALAQDAQLTGIWGGLTGEDRRLLRVRERKAS